MILYLSTHYKDCLYIKIIIIIITEEKTIFVLLLDFNGNLQEKLLLEIELKSPSLKNELVK